jgi:hypothetical protein
VCCCCLCLRAVSACTSSNMYPPAGQDPCTEHKSDLLPCIAPVFVWLPACWIVGDVEAHEVSLFLYTHPPQLTRVFSVKTPLVAHPLMYSLSACVQGQLLAYAGVGVVQGSEVAAEWQELNLKVRLACCWLTLSSNCSCMPDSITASAAALGCCWLTLSQLSGWACFCYADC